MTIDQPGLAPPPPSNEAVQLAELHRAELLTMTRSQTTPSWVSIITGTMFAADVWAFSLPLGRRSVVIGLLGLLAIALQFVLQRRAGITPFRGRTPRGLATPSYWVFGYLAVGCLGLYGLWQIAPWPAVAGCGFALGASAHRLQRHKLAAAVRRLEAEAFGPPTEVGR